MSVCRICLEKESRSNKFVYPCKCKGDVGKIHEKCLIKWIETSKRSNCEICSYDYQQEEVFAFNLNKYCSGCTKIQGNHTKTILTIFCLSLIILNTIIEDEIILFLSCTTVAMYVSSVMISYKVDVRTAIDSLLLSKIAFTVALMITFIMIIINSETRCDNTCFFGFNTTCDSLCPAFFLIENTMNNVSKNFFYDIINLFIIVFIRAVLMIPEYNKKIVFKSIQEQQSLLNNDII